MVGSYNIKIKNKRVSFKLNLVRNITIIKGDSATGKTTLINMIADYQEFGKKSGVKIDSDKPCVLLKGASWESELSNIKNSFVFIDEGNKFVKSVDFATAIKHTDNYYVIITREDLKHIPYSVNEIYELKKIRKSYTTGIVYNELKNFYTNKTSDKEITLNKIVLTEDSNSGYNFFKEFCNKNNMLCLTASGKSKILLCLKDIKERVLVVADGAAFGSEMDAVYKYCKLNKNITLYLPESFEWMILKSDIINSKKIKDILENPELFIDSSKYFSWEVYFTHLLVSETENTIFSYSKKTLNKIYLIEENMNKILMDFKKEG